MVRHPQLTLTKVTSLIPCGPGLRIEVIVVSLRRLNCVMTVTVNFYGHLQHLVGKGELTCELEGQSIHDLIAMIGKYSSEFANAVLSRRSKNLIVVCLINGCPVCDLKTQLCEGDRVNFLPILAGG